MQLVATTAGGSSARLWDFLSGGAVASGASIGGVASILAVQSQPLQEVHDAAADSIRSAVAMAGASIHLEEEEQDSRGGAEQLEELLPVVIW